MANHGSVIVLTPLTDAARDWFAENVEDGPAWAGGHACDARPGWHIVEALQDEGFTVQ